jgi:hypothetical protein
MRFFAVLAGLAAALVSGPAMAAEEPSYTLVERVGSIEIRDYPALIHAEVTVRGDRQGATRRGFGPLANYIFGGNQPREEIAMTAPVTASRSGQSIAMTAPVTSEPVGEGEWVVSFIMPPEWTMQTLPVANDPDVRLREAPPRRVAVIAFSGVMNERRAERHLEELEAFLSERGLTAQAEPTYAAYNPPWIPGPFRRNEIWIEISAD